MTTEKSTHEINFIKSTLTRLDFPLLGEPRRIDEGYEIVFDLENKKRIGKKAIRAQLQSLNLAVADIDVFNDKCGHYAYALVNPEMTGEAQNG